MRRIEAEKLLGGHATGTLTEAERRSLFAAALEHQAIFDALMDEEALRELLADPAAKAQLLAVLAPAAPKVVPFWRRTGVLGAAASLLVASLAGIAYLRNPEPAASALRQEKDQAPAAKAVAAPVPAPLPAPATAPPRAPEEKAKDLPVSVPHQAVPAPPPPEPAPREATAAAAGAPVAAVADASREKAAEYRRADAQDNLARKAEAPKSGAAVAEVLASVAPAPVAKKSKASPQPPPAALAPGAATGLVGGVTPAAPQLMEGKAAAAFKPAWTLEPQADGTTRIQVKGPADATAVLLKRGSAGVEALGLRVVDPGGDLTRWVAETRLAAGDVLDLYLLNAPVAEPTRLPESGPVDGFRARIHPSAKKAAMP